MPTSLTKNLAEQILLKVTRSARVAITVARTLVKVNATTTADATQCELCGANGEVLGIIEAAAVAGEYASIICAGHAYCLAGGTIAIGDELVSDASGQAVARGTTATVNYLVFGKALSAAAAQEWVLVAFGRNAIWGTNAS